MSGIAGLSLQPKTVPGSIRPKVGGDIDFERVLLELDNRASETLRGPQLRLEARQGTEVICEIDEPLAGDLAPGGSTQWDLYDLFLERGRGFPSKVHLFGLKAALGWDFTVQATISASGSEARTAFRFTWSGDPAGPVTATVKDLS